MFFQILVFLLVIAGVVVWYRFQDKLMGGYAQSQGYDKLNAMLFEKTGFRHKSLQEQSLEQNIAYSNQLTQQQISTGQMSMELVRDFGGHKQSFLYTQKTTGAGDMSLSARWTMQLQRSPSLVFHIAERDMNSMKREVKTGFEREFVPVYKQELRFYEPELAKRFRLWGNDEAAVNALLNQPAIYSNLLNLKEVDLCVFEHEVSFSDPTQENLRSGMGGGMEMIGASPESMMTAQLQIHQQISELLLEVAKTVES
jgi:hypothetical protein